MSIRPFWKSHPILLRLTAGVMLIFSPLLITYLVIYAAWEDRAAIGQVFQELWIYVVQGAEE